VSSSVAEHFAAAAIYRILLNSVQKTVAGKEKTNSSRLGLRSGKDDVRFGSFCDIGAALADVRSWCNSRHTARPSSRLPIYLTQPLRASVRFGRASGQPNCAMKEFQIMWTD
jgi:hypothetical protein